MTLVRLIGATTTALFLGASASFAVVIPNTVINFEADTDGAKANGFSSVDSALAQFTDTSGSDLSIVDGLTEGDGKSLVVRSDDTSALQVDFLQDIEYFSLDFGNDDPCCVGPGGFGVLEGYLSGSIMSSVNVLLNLDDLMNQSIDMTGLFDQVLFYYAEANGDRANLIEVVDNIEFRVSTVPLPAALPLLLAGLGGLGLAGRRRKSA